MAFSAEDKARIKQRAQEIIDAEGIAAGEAAQRAIRELFSFEQIQSTFEVPSASVESVIGGQAPLFYEDVEPLGPMAPIPETGIVARPFEREPVEEITPEIQGVDLQLEQQALRYRTERTRQLEREGYTRQEAETIANREIEQNRRAAPLGFGSPEEREERLAGLIPFEGRETPIGAQQAPQPSRIDYSKIQTIFEEQAGMERPEASDQTQVLKDLIIEPRRRSYLNEGVPSEEADERAINEAFDFLESLNVALTDESTYEQPEPEESGNQWIRAFSTQIQRGPGVPQLNEEQRNYLNATIDAQIERETDRILEEESPTTDLYSGDFRPLTRDEVRQQVIDSNPRPWWITEDADLVRLNPEEYEVRSLGVRTTPYGTKSKTVGNWLLSGALLVPNVLAGAVSEGLIRGFGEEDVVEQRREAREEKGFDSAVLLNVAENRGFTGEAVEYADLAELEGFDRYALIGTAVAADILDPSLDFIKGAVAGTKAGYQTFNNVGKLYGNLTRAERLSTAAPAFRNAVEAGFAEFNRDYLGTFLLNQSVGRIAPRTTRPITEGAVGRFGAVGDVRSMMAGKLADDYTVAMILSDLDPATTKTEALKALRDAGYGPAAGASVLYNRLRRSNADTVGEALTDIQGALRNDTTLSDLATIGRGEIGDVLRRKDLARTIGALSSVDEGIETTLRNLPDPPAGTTRIQQFADTLRADPKNKVKLFQALSYDKAARDVFDATADINAFDNLVAITPNTYAGPGASRIIIGRAQKSPLGKIAKELENAEVELVATVSPTANRISRGTTAGNIPSTTSPKVQPAYKVSDEQARQLEQIANQLQQFGKLSNEIVAPLIVRLETNRITFNDLRQLIHANVDLIAEGVAASKVRGITRARDVSRLPISKQIDFIEPLESRLLVRPVLRYIREELLGAKKIQGNLTVSQRQLLQRAQAEASALDQRLVRDLKQLRDNPDIRKLYDIPEGEDLSLTDLLAYLIVGPRESVLPQAQRATIGDTEIIDVLESPAKILKNIENSLLRSLNDLFFSKETQENIFDVLTGTHVQTNSRVFTEAAIDKIRESPEFAAAVQNIYENPAALFTELQTLATRTNETILQSPDSAKFLRYPKESITYVLDPNVPKGRYAARRSRRLEPGTIPAETLIAAYYRAEADRIVDSLLSDLVTKEIGKGQINIANYFTPQFMNNFKNTFVRAYEQILGRTIDIGEALDLFQRSGFVDLLRNRIIKNIKGEDLQETAEDTISILYDLFPGQRKQIEEFFNIGLRPGSNTLASESARKSIIDSLQAVSDSVIEIADDIAKGIIRRNGLRNNDVDIAKIEKLFDDVSTSPAYESNLRLLFGDNVAAQLQDEFLTGYENIRNELVSLQNRQYKTGIPAQTAEFLRDAYDVVTNLIYTILLNMRPRFHGANLLTGMDIAYSTTGRIVNPLDVLEGAKLLRNPISGFRAGSVPPNKVMFSDAFGRPYTAGELRPILEDITGRSVYRMEVPRASSRRLINLLERPTGANIREAWNLFKELPQAEDLLFRYAILKQALKEGRTLDEAIALAKRSMFDSGNISKAEKQFQRIALFYGFMRNNIVNAIRNMTSLRGLKRIGRVKRLRDLTSDLLVGEEANEYAPSYAQTRALLGTLPLSKEKEQQLVLASPSLATLDGVYTLADIIKLEVGGIFGGSLRPEFKTILGVEDSFDREFKKVPPEHIAILSGLGVDPTDVINYILGIQGAGPIVPTPGQPRDGAVNGSVYMLTTPEQRRAYKRFYDLMAFTGATTFTSDVARTALTGGLEEGGLRTSPLGRFGAATSFGFSAVTPMSVTSPERQAYYDRLSRLRSLQQQVRDVTEQEETQFGQELTPEQRAKGERAEQRRQDYDVRRQQRIITLEDLEREIRIIKERRYSILRAYNAAVRRGDRDEAQRLKAENDDLKARQRELQTQREQMAAQEEQ